MSAAHSEVGFSWSPGTELHSRMSLEKWDWHILKDFPQFKIQLNSTQSAVGRLISVGGFLAHEFRYLHTHPLSI